VGRTGSGGESVPQVKSMARKTKTYARYRFPKGQRSGLGGEFTSKRKGAVSERANRATGKTSRRSYTVSKAAITRRKYSRK
jgi:hypothetical protein